MMRLARANPRPQPLFLVVKPGLKTLAIFAFGMPLPVSEISMNIFPSLPFRILMAMVPALPIASTAFLHKFSITHSKRGVCTFAEMVSDKEYTSKFILDDTRGCRYVMTLLIRL